ncbi:MAG: hypothetical protein ACOC7U_00475 [Spirochaetota bacterium]
MWLKWFPWRFIIKRAARSRGFIDPLSLFSRFRSFAQPSEVMAPMELLRAGALFQARGLINSQAIQHNLDWVWPYWIEQQFNPRKDSFIPRAFTLTHINITNRNWTAVGIPGFSEMPVVDPRGLVMPFFDSWSIDAWIVTSAGEVLLPSRAAGVSQKLDMGENGNIRVITEAKVPGMVLEVQAEAVLEDHKLCCRVTFWGYSGSSAWLVVSVRPCNPEGVSFIHHIRSPNGVHGFTVNRTQSLFFNTAPQQYRFSNYQQGDVFHHLPPGELFPAEGCEETCRVGMATGAALFGLTPGSKTEVTATVPLSEAKTGSISPQETWKKSLNGRCRMEVPGKQYRFLYKAALRTLVLHTPGEVYAGCYTYKRFWFRDAAIITYALMCAGFLDRAEGLLNRFVCLQHASGYFVSQEGEWDSNGQVLWAMETYCRFAGKKPPQEWARAVRRAAKWIQRKRLSEHRTSPHAGLLPPGFSAEHLGTSDYYYWDDFWSVAGLRGAAHMMEMLGYAEEAEEFEQEEQDLLECIEKSLERASSRIGRKAMPASPYRRLDSGSVGSLSAGHPLLIFGPRDSRLLDTVDYLMQNCFMQNGFFHDISHSGINPYLTLHTAQVMMRAGDSRFFALVDRVAGLASPTGQWPEAIHPWTGSGCMGDGQHVWAAAEWVMMLRNCFVREEQEGRLVLCSGVKISWLENRESIRFGPAPTRMGSITLNISIEKNKIIVSWDAEWHRTQPEIEVCIPGYRSIPAQEGRSIVELELEGDRI